MKDARADLEPAALARYRARATELADEARRIVRAGLAAGFRVDTKADRTLVTDVDREVEHRLRELIEGHFPDHGIVGEEEPPVRPDSAFQWILDPIDGTEEFAHGIPTFGTMLALHYRDQPIVGVIDHPALDLRVSAAFGLGTYRNGERVRLLDPPETSLPGGERLVLSARWNFTRYVDEGRLFDAITRDYPNHRIYRACYAHTCVITGAADAMVDMHNRIWDQAASRILVEEAGGKYVVVRELEVPDGGRVYSAVFGKSVLVNKLAALFAAAV